MASVIWDANEILLINHLEEWETINTEYDCDLLGQLN